MAEEWVVRRRLQQTGMVNRSEPFFAFLIYVR